MVNLPPREFNLQAVPDVTRQNNIIRVVGDGDPFVFDSDAFIARLKEWQKNNNLSPDGEIGPRTMRVIQKYWASERDPNDLTVDDVVDSRPLTFEAKLVLIDFTTRFEGGFGEAAWGRLNLDGEYEGKFDKEGYIHPASKANPDGGYHLGVSLGKRQHNQLHGSLGKVLIEARKNNKKSFDSIFGGEQTANELISVTNSKNDKTRVGPVADRQPTASGGSQTQGSEIGHLLWHEPWIARFKAAGKFQWMRDAQNTVTIRDYLDPAVEALHNHGVTLHAENVAVAFDIAIQFGRYRLAGWVQRCRTGDKFLSDLIGKLPKSKRPRREWIKNAAAQLKHVYFLE